MEESLRLQAYRLLEKELRKSESVQFNREDDTDLLDAIDAVWRSLSEEEQAAFLLKDARY